MATLTETDYTRVATETAESFIDQYYTALNASRNQIKTFYLPSSTPASGRSLPHISFNGELVQGAAALQETFEKQMPYTHFEAQSVNAHVLNPVLIPTENKSKKDAERNMSITIQVSGHVRLIERKEGPMRGFSDSFVLVPNTEAAGGKGTGKQNQGQQWVIQSQNFRFVV